MNKGIPIEDVLSLSKEIQGTFWGKSIMTSLQDYPRTSEIVLIVLIEMAFQIGVAGVFEFKKMLAALIDHDFELAAAEMLNSPWAKQQPDHAQTLAKTLMEIYT